MWSYSSSFLTIFSLRDLYPYAVAYFSCSCVILPPWLLYCRHVVRPTDIVSRILAIDNEGALSQFLCCSVRGRQPPVTIAKVEKKFDNFFHVIGDIKVFTFFESWTTVFFSSGFTLLCVWKKLWFINLRFFSQIFDKNSYQTSIKIHITKNAIAIWPII